MAEGRNKDGEVDEWGDDLHAAYNLESIIGTDYGIVWDDDYDGEELVILDSAQEKVPEFIPGQVQQLIHDGFSTRSKRHPNDGCGRPSPVLVHGGQMPNEWVKSAEKLRPLAERLRDLAEQSGLLQEMRKVQPSEWTNEMFDDILEQIEPELCRLVSPDPGLLDTTPEQPMRLNLIRAIGELADDPDVDGVVVGGVPAYVDQEAPLSGLWPKKDDKRYDPNTPMTVWGDNYKSVVDAKGRFRREIDRQIASEIQRGWMEPLPDGQRPTSMGRLAMVHEGERNKRDQENEIVPKLRLPYDSAATGLNARVKLVEKQELAGPEELDSVIEYANDKQKDTPLMALKLDFTQAFRQVEVRKEDRHYFGMVHDGKFYQRNRLIEGFNMASWHWARHSGVFMRSFKKAMSTLFDFYTVLYFVDDILAVMNEHDSLVFAAVYCLMLRLIRAPVSWGKTVFSKRFTWVGYLYDLEKYERGIPDDKHAKLCEAVLEILSVKDGRIDFLRFQKFICRMGWLSRVLWFLKPFLKRAYGQLAQIRRQTEKKGRSLKYAYIRKFKVEQDLPIWIWLLKHRQTVIIPKCTIPGTLYKCDAYGESELGGIGGWKCSSDDYSEISWFAEEYKKGQWHEFASSTPQSLISPLEAVAQYVGMRLWAPSEVYYGATTDSMVTKWALGSFKARSPPLIEVLRMTAFHCLRYQVYPKVVHELGIENVVADNLSRFKKFIMGLVDPMKREKVDLSALLNDKLKLDDVQPEIDSLRQLMEGRE